MSDRDNFSSKTKNAVAARAGWRCSYTGCPQLTVGPSEEAPDKSTNIGVAAHISGAAPGLGSRRYNLSMKTEERSGIANAIWLCANHATLIDRDEVTYTAEQLLSMKREHEAACAVALRSGSSPELGTGLLAIGSDVVCTGDVMQITATSWTLRLKHFVLGDVHKVSSFISSFASDTTVDRYVLSTKYGDGRELSGPPIHNDLDGVLNLACPISPALSRIDVHALGSSLATHPDTNDLYLDKKGSIARLSGLEYFPQYVQSILSVQRGESPFFPTVGMRFFEYFEAFKGSPWLSLLLTLDVIREAAIAYTDPTMQRVTPLRCVTRVRSVELLSEVSTNHRLPVRVDFDVQGVGGWRRDIAVYMPTAEQMAEQAQRAAAMLPLWTGGAPSGEFR